MAKSTNDIICSIEEIAILRRNLRLLINNLRNRKKGLNREAEAQENIKDITVILSRHGVAVRLTDSIWENGSMLCSLLIKVRSAGPTENHIMKGIAHA